MQINSNKRKCLHNKKTRLEHQHGGRDHVMRRKLHCWPNLEDVYRFSPLYLGSERDCRWLSLRRYVLTHFSFRSLQLQRLFFVGCPSLLKVKSNLWYFIFFILFCVCLYSKGFAQIIAKPIRYQVKPFHCR